MHPVPRQVDRTCDSGERHLLDEHQHERLEQQRKAAELANPVRFDQPYGAIGQTHARHPHFEETIVLEEIQMTQTLDLRVVHKMFTSNPSIGKPAACNEVHGNRELPLSSIELNALDVPREVYGVRLRTVDSSWLLCLA
jgi:hypothetical protein